MNLLAPCSFTRSMPILFLWYCVSKQSGVKVMHNLPRRASSLHKHMQRRPMMAARTMQPMTRMMTNITGTSLEQGRLGSTTTPSSPQ